jgi:hypothetical protein
MLFAAGRQQAHLLVFFPSMYIGIFVEAEEQITPSKEIHR